jgi:hypothetical protein
MPDERGPRPARRGRRDRDDGTMTVDVRRESMERMRGRYWATALMTGLHQCRLMQLLSPHGPGLAQRQRGRTDGQPPPLLPELPV